jgi:ABC-2 type transport system ATP-binding protein
MKIIEISKLHKVYTKGVGKKIHALKGIDLEVGSGEIFGFLGPNGAGKSTTIKLILNIIHPTSGEILLSGNDVRDPESRRNLGYLPENPIYYEYLTPEELLRFVGKTFKVNSEKIREKTDELLNLMGLENFRQVPLRYFSKGMIQKIGLAQTLVHEPDILILDEPTSGLDPIGRRQVTDLILSLKEKGKTIFFSSHILHDVETICDKVGIIVEGEMRFCGKLSEVLHQSLQGYEVIVQNVSEEIFKEILEKQINCHREGDTVRLTVLENDLWQLIEFIKSKNLSLFAVEPKRKTLEGLFLELINKSKGS